MTRPGGCSAPADCSGSPSERTGRIRGLLIVLAALAVLSFPADAVAKRGCRTKACEKRVWVKHQKKVVGPYRAILERIAVCESTSRWSLNSGNGFYGGLQFSPGSWRTVGGKGLPHQHGKLEQMYRAVRLQRLQGWGAWPVCRHSAGV